MELTKDIIVDLLPVYLAGEGSADTRAAVEAHLATDAELRHTVLAAGIPSPLFEMTDSLPASLEMQSLNRTREQLGRKNFWLGFALIFSFAPLALGRPWVADLGMLVGLGGWAMFLLTCKELSATGLEAPRQWLNRQLWAMVSGLLGIAAGSLIEQQTGWHAARTLVPVATYGFGLWIGEKFHQIASVEEMNRPTTLLGK
jgi:hypothetical protein